MDLTLLGERIKIWGGWVLVIPFLPILASLATGVLASVSRGFSAIEIPMPATFFFVSIFSYTLLPHFAILGIFLLLAGTTLTFLGKVRALSQGTQPISFSPLTPFGNAVASIALSLVLMGIIAIFTYILARGLALVLGMSAIALAGWSIKEVVRVWNTKRQHATRLPAQEELLFPEGSSLQSLLQSSRLAGRVDWIAESWRALTTFLAVGFLVWLSKGYPLLFLCVGDGRGVCEGLVTHLLTPNGAVLLAGLAVAWLGVSIALLMRHLWKSSPHS